MSSPALEAFLARLYTEPALLQAFVADPQRTALGAGLTPDDAVRLQRTDTTGLQMAAASFARKRESYQRRKTVLQRLLRLFRG